ncbi:MAG: peroxiredoxin [Bdellovibrionota bacterium]|nr:peroxiredoxin [Bdellovibrionota bacterium]
MATKQAVLGKKVPAFKLESSNGENRKLSDFKGKNVVIYFYPKDSTPGCTTEGLDFNAALAKFKRQETVILGVSRDSIESHLKFIDKQGFKFELLSDPDEILCEMFDVMKMKNLYGRKFRGIERSTFLIDKNGKLVKEWRKVKVKEHVNEVLEAVKSLNKGQLN